MKDANCVFCNIEEDKIIVKNEFAFVINDKYPHSKGHVLIIPIDHCESYFNLPKETQNSMTELLNKAKNISDSELNPSGYNISVNDGKAAGQIVMHAHVHLIPRYGK